MTTSHTFDWENTVLGGHAAYPGHPIVVACMIMDRYQDLAHASRVEDGEQFMNASCDQFIPGAGDAVSTAIRVLRIAQEEGVDAAYRLAERYWDGNAAQSPKNATDVALGTKQFEHLKPRFEAHLATWGTPDANASEFRLPDASKAHQEGSPAVAGSAAPRLR